MKPLEVLLWVERVHRGLEPKPRPISALDRELLKLPEPLLPPDFPRHGEPAAPSWEPAFIVDEFLFGAARRRVLTAKKKKRFRA
jgi:hypothetical protein